MVKVYICKEVASSRGQFPARESLTESERRVKDVKSEGAGCSASEIYRVPSIPKIMCRRQIEGGKGM